MKLYENITDLVWDYQMFRSMVKHYQKHFNCSKAVSEDYVKTNCIDDMRKYYERLYLPKVNLQMDIRL